MKAPDFPPELLTLLRAAKKVAALTGAGISAESGVPTFRDAQTGLWARFRPEDLATPEAFQRDPRLVWDWYAWRRSLVAAARPNPGHCALAEMETRIPEFTLITQNVDGLHRQAGSRRVVELHGSLQRIKCSREGTLIDAVDLEGEAEEGVPRCPGCGSLLRPDVVWFGEALPEEALHAAWGAAQTCEVFFSIGTSGLVEPAASLPILALRAGAVVVEVNPNETPLTRQASFAFGGPAGEILPALVDAVWGPVDPSSRAPGR